MPDKRLYRVFALFIYALFTYGWFSANVVMPILPELTGVFQTSQGMVEFSVTAFLFGFAFLQLLWGPISDRIGRKHVLFIGFSITTVAAVGAAFAPNVSVFIAARFIEALGIACGPVMARSIMMDVFDQKEITHVIAISAIVVAVMPAIGPILGGWLSELLTWHSVLLFLAVYGAVMLLVVYIKIPETNLYLDPTTKIFSTFKIYVECMRHKRFVGAIILYALYYGAIIGFYTNAPFIFIQGLKYSPTSYGWFMLAPIATYIAGAYLARHFIKTHPVQYSVKLAILMSVVGTMLLYILNAVLGLSVTAIILPISIFIIGSGLISPTTNTIAMTVFVKNKGAAAALIGCSMALGSAVFSSVVALFHSISLTPMLVITTSVVIISSIVYWTTLTEPVTT